MRSVLSMVSGMVLALAVLVMVPAPALAAGTLTVSVTGQGSVTGEGISCTQGGGDCMEFYDDVETCDYNPHLPEPVCTYEDPTVTLTATAQPGYYLGSWSNCPSPTGQTCRVMVGQDRAVTATFLPTTTPDTTLPTVFITAPSPVDRFLSGTYLFEVDAWDNVGIKRVEFWSTDPTMLLGTDTTAPYQLPWDTTQFPDTDSFWLTVKAIDSSDLVRTTHRSSLSIDNTAPLVSVTGPAGSVEQASSYAWDVTATDANLDRTSCSLVPAGQAEQWGTCTSPAQHTATGLPPGSYELDVEALDAVGNVTRVSRVFTVVPPPPPPPPSTTTPPPTTTTPPPPPVAGPAPDTILDSKPRRRVSTKGTRTRVKVTFHATLSGAKFQCKVDGGGWKTCTSAWKPRLKVGRHVLQVRAVTGTSVDATPAKVKVRVVRV